MTKYICKGCAAPCKLKFKDEKAPAPDWCPFGSDSCVKWNLVKK